MESNPRNGNNFFLDLFGTIAGNTSLGRLPSDIGFIPDGTNGETIKIKGESATWLGLRVPLMQKYAYDYCYPLSSVIDRLAESDITGIIDTVYSGGKGDGNSATNDWAKRMRKLLKQPNPMQSWEQFRAQQTVYKKTYGYCPVLPFVPVGFEYDPSFATSIINLPPWLFGAVATYKLIGKTKITDIIKEYTCSIMGERVSFSPDKILLLEDSFVYDIAQNWMLPQSRLVGLDMAISNICAAMEADNVLLRKKGPLGFISHDAAAVKDSTVGYLPMTAKEKEELQETLAKKYGMNWGQYQWAISRQAVKWNPTSFNVKDLGTKETVLAGARAICQRFGFPYVLFEDSDATFSNQERAHKKLYDNNVIPNNNRDMAKYNIFFKAEENGCRIQMDYSHLSVFQEDALNAGRARAYNDQGLQIEYLNDIITKNQWLELIGLEKIAGPEGDLYYSQSSLAVQEQAAKLAQQQAAADKLKQTETNTQ